MKTKGTQIGIWVGLIAIALGLHGWVGTRAQGVTQVPSASIAELISEVKLMRAALQEMAKDQSQLQVLGAQIAAQQGRVAQASASLEAASAQLTASTARAKEAARELAGAQAALLRTTDIAQRTPIEQRIAGLKQLVGDLSAAESDLQARVFRLQSALSQEEQRWQQLSSRLDTLARSR